MIPPLDQIIAVILAGGFGTRIRHLLPDLPKPMAPVSGRPFLEWVVRYLAAQGIRRVTISTGYGAEKVEQHFRTQPVANVLVRCVPETEPMGTAGGFVNAVQSSPEPPPAWLVLNGDSLAFAALDPMAAALDESAVAGVILGVAMADASRYGTVVRNSKDDLIEFAEKQPGAGVINAGVYLLRAALVGEFPKRVPLSFEKEVFPELIARQVRLRVSASDAPFLDIGTPESLPEAERFIRDNRQQFEGL